MPGVLNFVNRVLLTATDGKHPLACHAGRGEFIGNRYDESWSETRRYSVDSSQLLCTSTPSYVQHRLSAALTSVICRLHLGAILRNLENSVNYDIWVVLLTVNVKWLVTHC